MGLTSRLPAIFEDEEETLHHDLMEMATRDAAARRIASDYLKLQRLGVRRAGNPEVDKEIEQSERTFLHNDWIRALYMMSYVWRHHQRRVDDEDETRRREVMSLPSCPNAHNIKGRPVFGDITSMLETTALNVDDRITSDQRVEIIPTGITHNDKENTRPRQHTLDNLFYNILPPMTFLEMQAEEGFLNLDQSNVVLNNDGKEGGILTATRRRLSLSDWSTCDPAGRFGSKSRKLMGLEDLFDGQRADDGMRKWRIGEEESGFRMAV
ncbi:MAG: hypothetical protein Q9204_004710 [Flavoplaca sp. TL-2023a]